MTRPRMYPKPPIENVDLSHSFEQILLSQVVANQTLSTVTSIVSSVNFGTDVTPLVVISPTINGNEVLFRVSGGTSGVYYLLLITVVTNLGNILQDAIILPVQTP